MDFWREQHFFATWIFHKLKFVLKTTFSVFIHNTKYCCGWHQSDMCDSSWCEEGSPSYWVFNAKQLLSPTFTTQSMSAFPCFPSWTINKWRKVGRCGGQNNTVDLVLHSFTSNSLSKAHWAFHLISPLKEDLRVFASAWWRFIVWNVFVVTIWGCWFDPCCLSTGFHFLPAQVFDVKLFWETWIHLLFSPKSFKFGYKEAVKLKPTCPQAELITSKYWRDAPNLWYDLSYK